MAHRGYTMNETAAVSFFWAPVARTVAPGATRLRAIRHAAARSAFQAEAAALAARCGLSLAAASSALATLVREMADEGYNVW